MRSTKRHSAVAPARATAPGPLARSVLSIAAIAAFAASWGDVRAQLARYSVAPLGTLGGGFSAGLAINDRGEVTGFSAPTNPGPRGSTNQGFVHRGDTMVPLGTLLSGPDSHGRAINHSGQVTGDSAASNRIGSRVGVHAFVYDRGRLTDLGTLGGASSGGSGINSSGQVTGSSSLPDDRQVHAFVYSGGAMRSIGTLGGGSSSGADINDRGEITGTSETADGRTRAFVYSGGAMRELGTLGGDFSSGRAINDRGQIVGVSNVPAPPGRFDRHAFFYSDGVMLDMGLLNMESFALDINDASQVVGWSWSADGLSRRGFLYADGVLHDVNDLLVTTGWFIEEAAGINNLGQIAATGCRQPGASCQAVRLDPIRSSGGVPTIGVASLLAAATVAMIAAMRRPRQATLPA